MNKFFKVIWNSVLNIWIVVGELAKRTAKAKSVGHSLNGNTQSNTLAKNGISHLFRKSLLALSIGSFSLFGVNPAQAVDITVTTQAALLTALSNGTYDKIILGADIALTQVLTVNMASHNVVIDGNGLYGLTVANTVVNGLAVSSGTGTLTLQNMSKITTANYYSMVYLTGVNTAVNVIYDNIGTLGTSQLAFMDTNGASTNSILTFGNILSDVVVNDRDQEIGEVNKVRYTGRFHVTHLGGGISFQNAGAAVNTATMDFLSGADVIINRTGSAASITNTGAYAFAYNFADNASFELIANQNVLSGATNNRGITIGSYNSGTGFGDGAKIILRARATGGGVIAGNAIDNATTNTAGINNGATGTADVIYNLATGSILNTTAAGILATKTGAANTSGIYISSGAAMNVATAGISASHAGSGNVVLENKATGTITAATGISATNTGTATINVANKGTINSTTAGIALSSSATSGPSQTISVDNTGGTINASAGTGVNVLSNTLLNLVGGTITTTGVATGLTFAGTSGNHALTDLILNLNGTGAAFAKAAGINLALRHVTFNVTNGTGLTSLAGLTFAEGVNGRNTINVTGTGIGITAANTDVSALNPDALDINVSGAGTGINATGGGVDLSDSNLHINVTNSGGTGLQVTDGAVTTTTIGADAQINAAGATAINFTGTTAKTLTNNGTINGAVNFAGTAANTINNNAILNGILTTGAGNDTLVLGSTSQSNGAINLGAGNNNVTIQNGAQVSSITTGVGDDTFTINNMTVGSTYLGSLNAGTGTNTLNFNASTDTLAADTSLQGFTNINLANSLITLVSDTNIGSGVITVDGASDLLFGSAFNGTLNASLGHLAGGDGSAIINSGANVALSQSSNFAGDWQVKQSGTLTASNSNQLGTAAIALDGTFNLNGVAATNNALTGTGALNIANTVNSAFDFGSNTGTAFAGTVNMQNATFNLSGTNSGALNHATLIASTDTSVAVGVGNQTIGNVTLDGGTTEFAAGSSITTDTLAVTNGSVVKVAPGVSTGGNLLDQDTGSSSQLINSTNALSATDLARLTLQDLAGNSLGNGAEESVVQGGNTVAQALYDYALTSEGSGLSVTSTLTELELLLGQSLTLTSAGAVNADHNLLAKLTGAGSLIIGADNSELTLTNATNDYTGTNTVNGGILNLGSDNALGATSALNTALNTQTNLNGHTQTVGALTNAGTVTLGSGGVLNSTGALTNSNTLNIAGGTLNLAAGGTSSATGGLTGAGTLNINGGDLAVTGANSGLSGQTLIASGASATLNGAGTLGSSAINVLGDLNLNGANAALANVLSGTGDINTNAAVTLTGTNSFSGAHHIGSAGALTVTQASNLGASTATVNLDTATSHLVLNGLSGAIANALSGVANSTVDITNGANVSLTGTNSGFAGQYALAGNSKLTVASTNNLGASANIALAGAQDMLALSGFSGTFANTVAGLGTLQVTDSSNATLTSSNGLGSDVAVDITNATLNLDDIALFNQILTGNGTLNVAKNDASTAFNFGTAVGGAFSGIVNLTNSIFALSADNSAALANATLKLSANNVTTVGTTDRTVHGLDLSGGTLIFDGAAPQSEASGVVTVTDLALNSGTVSVTGTDSWTNQNPVIAPNVSLLDQDRGDIMLALINATSVTGDVSGLDLMINGTSVTSGAQGVISSILQGGTAVANATHNYGLTSSNGSSHGLYVNYSLSALALLTDDADALLLATDSSASSNKTLNALVSGVGGLQIDATNGALTLANGSNSYQGKTTVNAGELILGANGAFGATSLLDIASGASANINGHTQTVGAITNAGTVTLGTGGVLNSTGALTNSNTLNIAGGTLNLAAGGTSSATGGLTGAGTLNINGGDLAVTGANSGLSGQTLIASGASATLNGAGTLGSSAINVLGDLNLNGANAALANVLSGNGDINTNAAVTLTGTNSFSGAHHIGATGALTVTQASNLGASTATVNLDTATSHLVLNGLSGAIANALSGVANSTVDITNGADMSLTGTNSAFLGQYALAGNSKLTVASTNNLGASANIALAGAQDMLALSGFNGTFANTVTGLGTLQVTDSSNATLTSSNGLGSNVTVDIADATLNLDDIALFNQILTGNGTLNVAKNDASTVFDFGAAVGGAFSGIVNLTNTTFNIDGLNTTALTNATLTLSSGSLASVADGVQNIGRLVTNGGTLLFNHLVDNAGVITSEGTLATSGIDTTTGGEIRVNLPTNVTPDLTGWTVMELDDGEIIVSLASGAATGTGRELTLSNALGDPLSTTVYQSVSNPGALSPAALGSFNYGLTTGKNFDGLYVNYGLTALELLSTGNDALILTATLANNGTQSNDISSQITGSGDLAFVSANDDSTASLSNSTNSYTGATWVRSGNLRLDANSALGQTSLLAMSTATTVDLNGVQQTVGQLTTETGSTLNFNSGNLTVTNGGQVDGALSGSGELSLMGGTLAITQGNSGFTGSTDIASGATAHLYQVQGLGSGAITNNGLLNLDNTSGMLQNSLAGSGNVQLTNSANVQLAADNSGYTGLFTTDAGTALTAYNAGNLGGSSIANSGELILDTASVWDLTNSISGSGTLVKRGSGTVKIDSGTVSAGLTTIEDGLLQLGSSAAISTLSVNESPLARSLVVTLASNVANLVSNVLITSTGSLGGYGQVTGNVENRGNLIMPNALTGGDFGTFTIDGNYTGDNGTVVFNTILAGDASITDRLVITGNTAGQSFVTVNNIGGNGARTSEGIKIIDVGGDSAGQFTLNGRAVAGAYEYFLYQGGVSSPADGDWYLRTQADDRRPEPASYTANLAAANSMFVSSLADRAGETLYTDIFTGEEKSTSLWLRNEGSHNRSRDDSGELKTQDNRYVMQLGGDVAQWSRNTQDLWRVGVMAGYANSSSSSVAQGTGYRSTGSANGYSLGVYGTWFEQGREATGVYVDSWLQYSWFNNEVSGEGLTTEKYDSKGFSASVESGYTFQVGQSEHQNYFIQPKAQMVWMGVKADSHTETNGTVVTGEGNNNIQTRLGVKAFISPIPKEDKGSTPTFKPYVEANWIHNTKDFGTTLDGMTVKQAGAGNVAELKVGVEGQINNKLNLWGNVGQQVGNNGYSDSSITLGVKYHF
ncbi:autotransporter outer membrane beta-barrel domain-containing protein [Yersinia frederiksenii]|uniref:autotransporter outer membrane beta-barrel domain-containing protein n=1 Tax=Yersinia frederiksenii TaxID=29484 RepID=UPI0005E6290D|nr:autotransporter outer membrane beta-barrel domain-containing protein [Yersinia frederiksenii]CQJ04052.1 autotransporter protein [Yersinia frederiksenii]